LFSVVIKELQVAIAAGGGGGGSPNGTAGTNNNSANYQDINYGGVNIYTGFGQGGQGGTEYSRRTATNGTCGAVLISW
jgi:hypothetical protein